MTVHRFWGSLPALVTPLLETGRIDETGVRTLIRRALDDGASGVLVAGTTGEGSLLEPARRAELTGTARAAIGPAGEDGPRLLAGAVGLSVGALVADVERQADAGADIVLVLPPSVQPLTPDELVDLHLDVAEAAPIPTFAYHIPQLTGSWLDAEVLPRLADHPNVIGLKDSSPDGQHRATLSSVTADRDDVMLFTGHAPSLLEALRVGAEGSILAVANVRQRAVVALHAAAMADDEVEATRRQDELRRLSAGLAETGVSVPAALKAALQLEGVIDERWCTPPLRSVAGARLDRIRTALVR